MSDVEDERAVQVAHVLHGVRLADADDQPCDHCRTVICTVCCVPYLYKNLCLACFDKQREIDEQNDQYDDVDEDHDRVNDAYNQPSPTWKYWKRT